MSSGYNIKFASTLATEHSKPKEQSKCMEVTAGSLNRYKHERRQQQWSTMTCTRKQAHMLHPTTTQKPVIEPIDVANT